MRSSTFLTPLVAATWTARAFAQTYATCNPLTSGGCPPDPALGKSVKISLTSASDSFTPQGNPTYGSNGAAFTIAKSGDSPQLTSKWYLMFGHVDFVVQAAPGAGIVSSVILQSDDLDEIDWEWLGGDDTQAQSNYFGKGQTTTYNRGAFHADPGNHDGFKTYSIDWTADQISWSINGQVVRTLSSSTASQYPYPQTPMVIKVGAWSGGDPSNPPGTIEWAGGPTDYSAGPYTMYVQSIAATDYSTGTQYTYSGTDGTWQSITAVGGSVNSGEGSGSAAEVAAAPSVTASSNSAPMPFQGTHSEKSSAVVQPNAGGWTPTTLQTSSTATVTTYPGLPPGWTVTSSGKVVPPSAAPVTSPPPSPSSSPADSQLDSPPSGGAEEVKTSYDEQGFPVIVTQSAGEASAVHSYDQQGFLVSPRTLATSQTLTPAVSGLADSSITTSSSIGQAAGETSSATLPAISKVSPSPTSGGARIGRGWIGISLVGMGFGLVISL